MTSSLVGSEMCIRDRMKPRHSSHRLALHQRKNGVGSHASMAERCHAILPVSYTHLTLPTICSV
eukprot:3253051-Prorocentrum_lima.AAC.1